MESHIDRIVREAAARGAFDHLPGKGKPQQFDEEGTTPEDLRLGYSMLKNAGYVPEEVRLLKEIEALKERLDATASDAERAGLIKEIREKRLRVDLFLDGLRRG